MVAVFFFVSSVVCAVLMLLCVSVLLASVHACADSRVWRYTCPGVCQQAGVCLSHPCTPCPHHTPPSLPVLGIVLRVSVELSRCSAMDPHPSSCLVMWASLGDQSLRESPVSISPRALMTSVGSNSGLS